MSCPYPERRYAPHALTPAQRSLSIELYYVPDKERRARYEAIVPGCMGVGATPVAALVNLCTNLEEGVVGGAPPDE